MSGAVRLAVEAFLAERHPGAAIERIAGDASTRAFFRLRAPQGATRILMDYGGPFEGETDDVRLERVFRRAGLPVARILEVAPEAGCLVLEDFGDRTLQSELEGKAAGNRTEVERLYREATALAARIATAGTRALRASDRAEGPTLDAERFRFEMRFFLEHYVSGLVGAKAPPGLAEELERLADAAARTPRRVLCHRDYHSRNLLVRPDGSLGIVDIQDARWGPDAYDLASLLFDAYVDVDPELARKMIAEYLATIEPPVSPERFLRRFHLVAAQRMIKMLGTFGYQVRVLGRDRYAEGIPRTLRRLRDLLPSVPEATRVTALLRETGLRDGSPDLGLLPP